MTPARAEALQAEASELLRRDGATMAVFIAGLKAILAGGLMLTDSERLLIACERLIAELGAEP